MRRPSSLAGTPRKAKPAAKPAAGLGRTEAAVADVVVVAGAQDRDARNLLDPSVRRILDAFRLEDISSHLMRRAHFMAEELFAQEFASEALTPRQKAALITVYQQPGLNQNALADRLFMDRNTVAEMVKRLAQGGLLQRISAKDDQRAYELFLAPAGAALLNRVMPRDVLVERRILERLPEEYRPLFIKCLHLLVTPPSREPGAS
jgi:DNA-binding MarR family transcriptional regulator